MKHREFSPPKLRRPAAFHFPADDACPGKLGYPAHLGRPSASARSLKSNLQLTLYHRFFETPINHKFLASEYQRGPGKERKKFPATGANPFAASVNVK